MNNKAIRPCGPQVPQCDASTLWRVWLVAVMASGVQLAASMTASAPSSAQGDTTCTAGCGQLHPPSSAGLPLSRAARIASQGTRLHGTIASTAHTVDFALSTPCLARGAVDIVGHDGPSNQPQHHGSDRHRLFQLVGGAKRNPALDVAGSLMTDPSSGHVALQGRRRYYRFGHPALSNVSPTPMAQWEVSERLWCSRKLQSPQALHGINEATNNSCRSIIIITHLGAVMLAACQRTLHLRPRQSTHAMIHRQPHLVVERLESTRMLPRETKKIQPSVVNQSLRNTREPVSKRWSSKTNPHLPQRHRSSYVFASGAKAAKSCIPFFRISLWRLPA